MSGLLRSIGSLLLGVAVVAGVALLLAGGVCLAGRQCTPAGYAGLAMDVGFVALGISALVLIGAARLNRNYPYQLARTASAGNVFQRSPQDVGDSERRIRFVVCLAGGGGLALTIGSWLWSSVH